jgi:hypothetical protein
MLILLRTIGFPLLLLVGVLGPNAAGREVTAQAGPLLAVHVDPTTAAPGARVDVTVIASGSGSYVSISVNVPTELAIGDDLRCIHKTSYCNGVSSTEGGLVTASAPGVLPGPDGYGTSTQVYVTFSVLVPRSAAPGTRFEINATMDGLFNVLLPEQGTGAQTFAVLTVGGVTGRQPRPSPTPTTDVSRAGQELPVLPPTIVGRTEVGWTGAWQYQDIGDSTGEAILLSQIDVDKSVITVATYGEVRDDTIRSPSAALNTVFEPLVEDDSLAQVPIEAGSGELDDGTLWKAYKFEQDGFHLTILITVSEAPLGTFIISTLLSDTESFEDSLHIAQQEILLNGEPVFLDGIEADLLVQ